MTWFLNSIDFYIVATLVAAMIVAFAARPAARGEARQFLLAGDLDYTGSDDSPSVMITALDDGTVVLQRRGLKNMTATSAVSLAVTVMGWDIVIEERLSDGCQNDAMIDTATFYFDFLAPERYHLRYNSESLGLFAATQLTNRPGYKINRQLMQ